MSSLHEKSNKYQGEAAQLAIAIDIAIEALQKHVPKDWETKHLDHFISVYEDYKNKVLNPEPQFHTMASLRTIENSVFTFFQESSGETVNYFWGRIKESNLAYSRINKLDKILQRGKIKNVIEYDYIKDTIVAAEQEGLTNQEQTQQLSQMLEAFEYK